MYYPYINRMYYFKYKLNSFFNQQLVASTFCFVLYLYKLNKGVAMSNEYNFQKELEKSLFGADTKLDRKELLEDIFKIYVAKLFEITIQKSTIKDRLPFEALVEVKRNLIDEFKKANLDTYQRSVIQYEELFEKTVQEIVNDAGLAHGGVDKTTVDQTLHINPKAYIKSHTISDGGIIIPSNN